MRSLIAVTIGAALASAGGPPATAMAAGAGNRTTLVIYDAPAKPFSLVNEIAPIRLMLARFGTAVVAHTADAVTGTDIEAADYLVVAGMCSAPSLAPEAKAALARTARPLLAIGWATPLAGAPAPKAYPAVIANATVVYRGLEWKMRLDPFFPGPGKPSEAMATPQGSPRPLIWRSGSVYGFGTLPGSFPASALFSDLLLDFYGIAAPRPRGLFFAIQNFHPGSDPAALRRIVDYFSARRIGFVVSTQLDNVPGDRLMPRDDFVGALKYAQSHGGRIILRGAVTPSIPGSLADAGITTSGWELPGEGGIEPAAPLAAKPDGYLLGTLLAEPGEPRSAFHATTLLVTDEGWPVLPLNINPPTGEAVHLRTLTGEVAGLSALRDSIAGVAIPAWLPFQQMRDIVDAAQSTGMPNLPMESLTKQ